MLSVKAGMRACLAQNIPCNSVTLSHPDNRTDGSGDDVEVTSCGQGVNGKQRGSRRKKAPPGGRYSAGATATILA